MTQGKFEVNLDKSLRLDARRRASAEREKWRNARLEVEEFGGSYDARQNRRETSKSAVRIISSSLFFFSFSFFILRRMGKNKALAHHTSAYFHTRRVSI